MNGLDLVCREVIAKVDGALAVGVVDLNSGLLLGVAHSVPHFTLSYLDAVGAAAVDMFRSRSVEAVEELLSVGRGRKTEKVFKEIQVTSDSTYHFLIVVPSKPDSLIVMVTSRSTNLGMGWAALRGVLAQVAPMCPG